ncbi:acetoacetate--CoA ligase [Cryptosporangium sp. NPDC051539]|uniref:acetoacetate--CoA ligase n=1 Tax=Cryptosporangium sp. NPDC051539 TaxID=3363962 RepID=UPI0037941204
MTAVPTDASSAVAPVWVPDPQVAARSRLAAFTREVEKAHGVDLADYDALWTWSVDHLEEFWTAVWAFFDMRSEPAPTTVLGSGDMPGATWFPGVRLNYVSHVFRDRSPDAVAVVELTEPGDARQVTWAELENQVSAVAAALRELGIDAGDRVVGYVPNSAAAIVAFLAAASIGAVWSCCGPDYAADAAANRLAQLQPRVLLAADGYYFGGKTFDRREDYARLVELLPTVEHVVHVPHLGLPAIGTGRHDVSWARMLTTDHDRLSPIPLPFDHPLWVLFSSGTTGIPKGLVHGHGGVALDYQKHVGLQLDVTRRDRMLWYSTTNWMMWNFAVNMLLLGASMVAYDGSPTFPSPDRLWQIAAEHDVTILGASPGYLQACEQHGTTIAAGNQLRMIGATGSPVPPAAFHWIAEQLGDRIPLVSMSGGTDIVSALATGAPTRPIWPGELSARPLGVAVDTWNEAGESIRGTVGELVVTKPMPTMPVTLWNDPDGSKYHEAYFATFPGVWRHGDWATITDRGSVIIHGRSDATLNRNGVRLGSADIYEIVEKLAGVVESLVVGVELPDGGYWMPLFVALEDGAVLDDELEARISGELRTRASRRHVPDSIIEVPAIPHTRTGKKLEVPIKRILQGAALDTVISRGAVDDPSLLDLFTGLKPPS